MNNYLYWLLAPALGLFAASAITASLGVGSYSPFNAIDLWLAYPTEPPKELLVSTVAAVVLVALLLFWPDGEKNKYGSASWANKRDLKKMGLLAPSGIILAKSGGNYIRFNTNLSVAVLAPPGTGKTAGIIVPTLLSCGNSMMIFDVKGELHSLTSKRRAEFSKVLRFAPTEADTICWNPLDKSILPDDWADIVQTVERMVAVLIPIKDDTDHWNLEARNCFIFYALYLIHQNGGGTSLPEIRALALSHGEPQEWIAETLDEAGENLPLRVIEQGNSLIGKADKEFSGVFSSFTKSLNVFGDERIAHATSRNDFLPSQLRKERTSFYLQVGATDLDRLAPLMRLLIESTAMYLLTVAPENGKTSFFAKLFKSKKAIAHRDQDITFVLDEFVRLGKMPVILQNPALSRGNRFNSIFVAQDWGQVRGLYGETGVSEMETTTAYKVIFQQNNYDTAERISRSIGDKTQKRQSQSRSRGGVSKSISEEAARLIRAQEITGMNNNTCLVLSQGFMSRPVKAKICYWFKDPALKKLVKKV